MKNTLVEAGLTDSQSNVYLFLLKNGESYPPLIASKLGLTRSNTYKILDSLVDLSLVSRTERKKKFVYRTEDPIALINLVAAERNRVIALEKGVKQALGDLRRTYRQSKAENQVDRYSGKSVVASLYEAQAASSQAIYFVKTRLDIPVMGFEIMDRLRRLSAKNGTQRYGITPAATESPANPELDKNTNLTRTWVDQNDYTSPVEWSVCGDELLIISFEDDVSAIRINNANVANAFKQLWRIMDRGLRNDSRYKKLSREAKRKI